MRSTLLYISRNLFSFPNKKKEAAGLNSFSGTRINIKNHYDASYKHTHFEEEEFIEVVPLINALNIIHKLRTKKEKLFY